MSTNHTYAGPSFALSTKVRKLCTNMHAAIFSSGPITPTNARGNLVSAALSAAAAGVGREEFLTACAEDYDYAQGGLK